MKQKDSRPAWRLEREKITCIQSTQVQNAAREVREHTINQFGSDLRRGVREKIEDGPAK